MAIARDHNEWLSLVPSSGPFLSLPVLTQAFPQGLDAHDTDHARRLRLAFGEWEAAQSARRPDPTIHRAWIKLVLEETLGFEGLLAEGQAIPQSLKSDAAEYGETLRPDWIVNDPKTQRARLLVQVYPRSQSLTSPVQASRWKTSPDTRMMQLLHDTGIRLGLVTNGDHWMLVNAPKNETSGYVSWYASLWLEESLTLRAFRTLLGAERFFGVSDDLTLEALLDRSAADQQEVTDQLGYQVRKAVEVLIQALDRADQDHGRALLSDVGEATLYESALTVMMRLVFLFCAEERELLLLGDDLYDRNYAVSTLREQLRITADQFGEEILGLRYDAWARLLTTFRAVYAGIDHDRLKLPAYGGSLFNPDRFPFLEGRKLGTSWKNTEATPLPVSNRTVLHLLEALQVLQVRMPGGGPAEARRLSFRALDIEQIGHVYEGLLDHTAKRATEPVLGLQGTREKEPEIALTDLERIAARGEPELLKFLKDETGRSESALKRGLNATVDDQLASRFRTACQDPQLWERVKPFAGLVRLDTVGYPVVITTGSVFVTAGTDRRSSGTHYTPRSLTEPIVQYTLEPLVYVGPAEGLPREQWKLRSARELLDLKFCDMACGSGTFLVQTCRYMAARVLEAWDAVQKDNPGTVRITPEGEPSAGLPSETLIPDDPDERQTYALRIVAQRCLYGVDKNPLAAEMAKLSLWLLTLAKDKPFEFLDHAIRCGDSLVGIHSLDQLRKFNLDAKGDNYALFLGFLDEQIDEAVALRRQIIEMPSNTAEDVEAQDAMLREANERMDRLKCAADLLVGAELLRWEQRDVLRVDLDDDDVDLNENGHWQPGWLSAKRATERFRQAARIQASVAVETQFETSSLASFQSLCSTWLNGEVPFHWPLEFPEVMSERGGFDAFVGNPPFQGGAKLGAAHSLAYRDYLVERIGGGVRGQRGQTDICAFMFCRAGDLLRRMGYFGLVATNTIAQGDTRLVGLDRLIGSGNVIMRAISSQKWPGSASLEVAIIWLRKGHWGGRLILDHADVRGITPYLSIEGEIEGPPHRLASNLDRSFEGIRVEGTGFILDEKAVNSLISSNPKNEEVIRQHLRGDDFTSRPDKSPSSWIINFQDWPLNRDVFPPEYTGPCASDYPECLEVVERLVKPQRLALPPKNPFNISAAAKWWQFCALRPTLQTATQGMRRVLFHAFGPTKYVAFGFIDSDWIVAAPNNIFAFEKWEYYAILQSGLHSSWAWSYGSTMETRLRYTRSSCFETFPFPKSFDGLAKIGEDYSTALDGVMLARQEGLTKTYNRFHDSSDSSADICCLRRLCEELDNAVAAAYGWSDLDLGHGFHETKQGVRFTIGESARREALARLLRLNHERYEEEARRGLHDKKSGKTARAKKKTETTGTELRLF
jgi:hypothetical protein